MNRLARRLDKLRAATQGPPRPAFADWVRLPDGRTVPLGTRGGGNEDAPGSPRIVVMTHLSKHATPGNVAFLEKHLPELDSQDVFETRPALSPSEVPDA